MVTKARNLVSEDMNWDILNVNFGTSHDSAIILSERLTREEIYTLFLLLANEKRKIMIRRALRNPLNLLRNPKFLLKALTNILTGKPLIEK